MRLPYFQIENIETILHHWNSITPRLNQSPTHWFEALHLLVPRVFNEFRIHPFLDSAWYLCIISILNMRSWGIAVGMQYWKSRKIVMATAKLITFRFSVVRPASAARRDSNLSPATWEKWPSRALFLFEGCGCRNGIWDLEDMTSTKNVIGHRIDDLFPVVALTCLILWG